ncbi:sce7726 family protein [Elstera cyanobacteriorum]|uniref:sce7726 family protein n=1 Tax=Elstera cyanobacteriorum TaxID=2022747 RepID=UPI002354A5A5|nr:sce7726 family protein [Elstera cyanobacteriorum]MCK6442295.1 sce7726 family protein [Elstera cyanobacteriorum]
MRDADIRAKLLAELATAHASDADCIIVEEMGVWGGSARIDVAVLNGSISGFEIKSNKDTLDRLPSQMRLFEMVFESLTIVVGDRHVDGVKSIVPRWCGVILAKDLGEELHLREIRKPRRNPNVDRCILAKLLWKEEVLDLLKQSGLTGVNSKMKARTLHEILAAQFSVRELAEQVRKKLKARADWLR